MTYEGCVSLNPTKQHGIAILDYGSQYTQIIARRIRELQVYTEIFHPDDSLETINQNNPKAYILSGGPCSVYTSEAPQMPDYLLE